MKSRLKIGIVGIGFGQQVHLPVFRADERCEVVALCASSQERAAKAAEKHGVSDAYGDWQSLCANPDLDAIAVATPPTIQPAIVRRALELGKAVFCEKPLAGSVDAARELVAVAEQAAVANMIDFEFPEIARWREARAILDSGALGRLRHVAVTWNVETYANRMGLQSWKTSAEQGGGTLNSFASHSLYYLEWLLGRIKRLSCRLGRQPGDERTADTVAVLCLELDSRLIVSISISSHAFLGSGHRLELYGETGTLVLENKTSDYINGFQLSYGNRESNRLDPRSEAAAVDADGRITAVKPLARRFVDWIVTGVPGIPAFRQGLRIQYLLDAARQSDVSGCWVETPELL